MVQTTQKACAGDIMQTEIVTASPRDTLRETLDSMTQNHVTGLPVMDSRNRLVGVISATDILNFEQENVELTDDTNFETARYFDPDTDRWEDICVTSFALEQFSETPVRELMNRNVISVAPETPLNEVARLMIEQDIHRVLVLEKERSLLGIVSAFDFVRDAAEV